MADSTNYAAIAAQNGAIGVTKGQPDYAAIAAQNGAIVTPQNAQTGVPTNGEQFAKDLGIGALKGAGQIAGQVEGLLNPAQGAANAAIGPNPRLQPTNTAQSIGKFGVDAIGNTAAALLLPEGYIPQIAGNAALGYAENPERPLLGAAAGALAGAGGQFIANKAPKIAETALGIGNKARAFGKTPGEAALELTRGFKPEAVAESAEESLNHLSGQLANNYASAQKTASLQPALDVLDGAYKEADAQNSKPAMDAIDDLRAQLSVRHSTGEPIDATQSAENVLALKRGIGDAANWNPNIQPKAAVKLARKVYRALDSELDRVAPENASLNQKISSLLEVKLRAELESRNAGLIQNVLHRAAAHTGALTSAAAGGYAGYREGGTPGAVLGTGAGLLVPELVANPTAQMMLARAARYAPKTFTPAMVSLSSLAGNRGQ